MTKLSAAPAPAGGKVDTSGGVHRTAQDQRAAMTSASATAARLRARTGGPRDDGPKIVEHIAGWVLVVVLAMLVTQLGLL
ncbi:hypothetical protein GCM10010448_00310 [Streptomyces glomeratus]|uniref:SCO1431 family membrane protein n=1 Tax=Streptomyces glomeratus TaxID=284452 RepID=A0ABN3Y850_9ACTN